MISATLIDGFLVLILLISVFGGWRQGAIASVLSAVGILSGLVISLGTAPILMGLTQERLWRFLILVVVVLSMVGMGDVVGSLLGHTLRDRMKWRKSQVIDSFLGAVFQLVAVLLVSWLIAVPVATAMGSPVADGVRESAVLRGVHAVAPQELLRLPNRISAMLDESGLPPLISPYESSGRTDVAAPSNRVASPELVSELRPSVIHVVGSAEACHRRLMGSGFVIADDYVLTNAHVVAGTDSVSLDTVMGTKDTSVVYYNSDIDIALLHTPGLGLTPLQWADDVAQSGDDAIVMGYPESGPFEAAPARIADRIKVTGSDIYASGRVEREAYSVRGSIREGNSGGPLLNAQGKAVGLVFGASRDKSDIGFALTAAEVQKHIGDVTQWVDPVDTMRCV